MSVALAELIAAAEAEAARELGICNACRYCEAYCAVFPAMTRRLAFERDDVHYLANLCHNCGACLYSCQYASPHEFAVNFPRAMAEVRGLTYSAYAWPHAFGKLYRHAGVFVALTLAGGLALFLWLAAMQGGLARAANGGDFYAVFPHRLLVALFGLVFGYALLALTVGVSRFWRAWRPGPGSADAALDAAGKALTLKFLDGGHGAGCNEQDDRFTLARRRFHHFAFYGFLLCFASTCVATLYHYLWGLKAPYALLSLPVALGTLGGLGLVVGGLGLLALRLKRDTRLGDPSQRGMDLGFIWLLLLSGASGLALLGFRDTAAMTGLLAIHLGIVMALFITLPYGKFAHGFYRSAALLKWAIEKRQPSRLKLEDS